MSLKWHLLVEATRERIHNHHFLFFIICSLKCFLVTIQLEKKWICTLDTDTCRQSSLEAPRLGPLWGNGGKWSFPKWLRTIKFQLFLGKQLQILFRYLSSNPKWFTRFCPKLTGTSKKMQISPQPYANSTIRHYHLIAHWAVDIGRENVS